MQLGGVVELVNFPAEVVDFVAKLLVFGFVDVAFGGLAKHLRQPRPAFRLLGRIFFYRPWKSNS